MLQIVRIWADQTNMTVNISHRLEKGKTWYRVSQNQIIVYFKGTSHC